jgi:hypothetical protein
MTGLEVVAQHTPRAVTAAPPSFEIRPPVVPELIVMLVTALVVKVGITSSFLQLLIIKPPQIRNPKTKKTITLFIIKYLN